MKKMSKKVVFFFFKRKTFTSSSGRSSVDYMNPYNAMRPMNDTKIKTKKKVSQHLFYFRIHCVCFACVNPLQTHETSECNFRYRWPMSRWDDNSCRIFGHTRDILVQLNQLQFRSNNFTFNFNQLLNSNINDRILNSILKLTCYSNFLCTISSWILDFVHCNTFYVANTKSFKLILISHFCFCLEK